MSKLNSLPATDSGLDVQTGRGTVNISTVIAHRDVWTRVRQDQNFAHFKGKLPVKDAVKRFNRYLETL